jgi:cytochrome c-type biogenesis protein CcmH
VTQWLASFGPTSFLITAFVLAALVVAVLARSLLSGTRDAQPASVYDMRVYKDQLKEIERDALRGIVPPEETERLRTEIARRMLAADTSKAVGTIEISRRNGVIVAVLVAVFAFVGSFWAYSTQGAPGFADFPLDLRKMLAAEALENRPDQAFVEANQRPAQPTTVSEDYIAMVEKLRNIVDERPDDLRGYRFLVRSEASLGNYTAAYQAQEKVIAILGSDVIAQDHAVLADLMVQATSGYISPEAESALRDALSMDGRNGLAQYYIGQMYAQTGRPDRGFQIWRSLLDSSPPEAPWVPAIRDQIEELAWLAGQNRYELPAESAPIRGPSAEDIEAAQSMSPEERVSMIQGMVSQLSDRLATEGGPVDDWARLIRAYGVLGDRVAAQAIYREAREVFNGDDTALRALYDAGQSAEIVQ